MSPPPPRMNRSWLVEGRVMCSQPLNPRGFHRVRRVFAAVDHEFESVTTERVVGLLPAVFFPYQVVLVEPAQNVRHATPCDVGGQYDVVELSVLNVIVIDEDEQVAPHMLDARLQVVDLGF